MRVLARIGYTLAGLALIAPAGARAGMPVVAGQPWSPAQQQMSKPSLLKSGKSFASQGNERLCGDCQRDRLKAQQGISVPPPPPLPPGTVVKANMCTACGRPAAVVAGRLSAPSRVMPTESVAYGSAPGRAVAGGVEAPGYAVSGNDPAPIGVVQPRLASAAPAGPSGPRDPSVMPTSSVASPSDPVMPNSGRRPKVLSHLFGLSAIGRDRAIARDRQSQEEHARIPYGAANAEPVQNLPSSVVYGR